MACPIPQGGHNNKNRDAQMKCSRRKVRGVSPEARKESVEFRLNRGGEQFGHAVYS